MTRREVLQVNTFHYLRGGDSRCMFATSEALRSRGVEVSHFAMEHERNLEAADARYFAPHVDYPTLLAQGGLGAKWAAFRSSIHSAQARHAIGRRLDAGGPAIAHLHSVMHHLTASVVLELQKRKVPMVWTLHDYKSVCPATQLLREGLPCDACRGGRFYNAVAHRCKRDNMGASVLAMLELYFHRARRVYESADLLIAPSSFLRDKVIEMGLRPRRIEVLPNFVDVGHYDASRQTADYLLFVGRLSPEKGVRTLIEAASAVPGLPLRIVGEGELAPELEALVKARGLGHIRFEGFRDGDELRDLYRGARAVVIPSECYENCPMVVLEAFAYGKPVLGSAMGGILNLIDPGCTGELVEAGDVEAWVAALRELGVNSDRWANMGAQARAEAEGRYDAGPHIDRLLELYREVSGEPALGT